MKLLPLVLISIICYTNLLAQAPNPKHSCSYIKGNRIKQKSISLSDFEIAQTLKYDVNYYKLDIAMNDSSTYILGTGTVQGKTTEATDSILIELYKDFTVHQIRINNSVTPYGRNNHAIKVPINAQANTNFKIEIDYEGLPPTQITNPMGGSGMTNTNAGFAPLKITYSLSEPFSAYEWFPCKQYLRDKADSIDVFVTVPSSLKAGSNGVLSQVVDLGNGTARYEWKHRHPIAYYLISVSVANYVDYSIYAHPQNHSDSILIQNYIYNTPGILNFFQGEIDKTKDFVELFSDIYGLYPFHDEKYGHCLAPLSGGMEHQTMTTQGFFSDELTSHELGHQWWGNSVTCSSWADIWINEGFASYSEYLMYEFIHSLNDARNDMVDRHNNIMSQPNGSVWVLDSLNDSRIFDSRLTYNKGAAIVHTLRGIVNNDQLFFQGLKNFLILYKNSTASGIDFLNFAENEWNLSLDNFFTEWYFGEGYPIYDIQWNKNNGLNLSINQNTSSMVTTLFTTPLEIKFSRFNDSDTIIRFNINSNSQLYNLPNIQNINELLEIDPNNYIINKVGSITEQDLLFAQEISFPEIKLYPNPAKNQIQLTNINKEVEYTIINNQGKKVSSGLSKGDINTSKLTAGSYILQLKNSELNKVLIFIKE